MKKNFVQKLALGLALVMTVTSVPVSSEAAAKPAFKTSSVTVTEGETVKAVIKKTKGWTAKKVVVADGTIAEATAVQKKKKVNVKVTGVKAGETVVKAVLKKGSKKVKAKLAVTVEAAKIVGTTITAAKAKAINAIDVAVVSDKTEFTNTQVVVYNEKTKVREAVKSVKVAEDGKNLVVTLYNDMVDGYTYSISVDGSEKVEFGVTIGEIASITVEDATVLPIYNEDGTRNNASDIVYHVYDENGLEITSKFPIANMNIETTAYIDANNQINLYHKGDAAKVKLTYNYYDKAAGKIVPIVSNEATYLAAYDYITSVNKWWISGGFGTNKEDLNWIAVGDTARKLNVELLTNKNVKVNATDFQTTDPTILFVGKDGLLEARKAGTVQVIAKNGEYQTYLTIEVKAARTFTALTTVTPSVTLSNNIVFDDKGTLNNTSDDIVDGETTTISFVAVDQYGCTMPTETANITTVSATNATDVLTSAVAAGSTATVKARLGATGTTYVKASHRGQTAFANIAVVTPGNHATYTVDGLKANAELDTYLTTKRAFTFTVYSVDANGVKRQVVTNNNYKTKAGYYVVNSKNEVMTTSGSGIALTGLITTSGSAISGVADLGLRTYTTLAGVNANTVNVANAQTSLANGTYSLVVEVNTSKVVVPFTIASTRTVPTVNAKSKNVNVTTANNFVDVLASTVLTTNASASVEGAVITSYIPTVISDTTGVITTYRNKTVPVLVKQVVVKDADGFFHIVTVGEVAYEGIVINAKVLD